MIYFVQAGEGGPIKIGYTAGDPLRRIAGLQTSAPAKLRLLASWPGKHADEMAFHRALAMDRLTGEWFRPSPAVMEAAATGSVKMALAVADGAAPGAGSPSPAPLLGFRDGYRKPAHLPPPAHIAIAREAARKAVAIRPDAPWWMRRRVMP